VTASPRIVETQRDTGTNATSIVGRHQLTVVPIDTLREFSSEKATTEPARIDDLYRDPSAIRPILRSALRGLATGIKATDQSLAALRRGEPIASDDAMIRLQMLLPELFCCRDLGDGFGSVINAIKISFDNAKGIPFNERQIVTIGQALNQIRNEPFLPFERAVDLITRLEDSGLIVEPGSFEALGDLLDVEGLH
jgi:hypothetical protein